MSASCSSEPDSRRSDSIGRFVGALLGATVELRDRDHRDLELLGQQLDLPGELRDLELAGLDLLARRHQLQVVDDDEPQVVALLEPPGLGPDLHHRHVGRVVDEQRRLGDLAHLAGQLVPVVVAHLAVAHVVQRDPRLGRQQPHGDLGAAHLQREDHTGQPVLDRRRPCKIECQGATCPIAGRAATMIIWPACRPLVSSSSSAKPVGTPGHRAVAVADRLELVERELHDVATAARSPRTCACR